MNWLIEDLKIQKAVCENIGDSQRVDDLRRVISIAESLLIENKIEKSKPLKSSIPITQRVKTFEDALAIYRNVQPNEQIVLNYNGINKKIISCQAYLKLTIIAEVLNEGWTPDWNNYSEYKYYPYFDMQTGKNGFAFGDSIYDFTYAHVGSRLCFQSKELADYAAVTFLKIYEDYMC